jgi:hypothetical protein
MPDWTDMTMTDWMEMSAADWMNRALSGWDRSYGEFMRTTPSEWLEMMFRPGMGMGMGRWRPRQRSEQYGRDRSRRGYKSRYEDDDRYDWKSHGRDRHHDRDHDDCDHHDHDHHHVHGRCRRCGRDSCECYCCIGDVDLAVYARLGEQRVIPIVVENERHREKQVTLELSNWTTRGGKEAPLETVILEPKTFTLAPCGEQTVTLVVRTRVDSEDDQQPTPAPSPAPPTTPPNASEIVRGPSDRREVPDVDDCVVVTADLRLVGCDHRPIRIAVALLPRDCDPFMVSCGCACC